MNARHPVRIALFAACLFAVCLFAVAPAEAGQPRTHDGFFLRLSAGGGYSSTSLDDGSSELKLSGGSGDVNLAIGGMIAPNLALHGTLLGWSITDPDVDLTGFGSGEINGDLSMGALGAGVTYYFMPANIYLSGTVGVGSLTMDLSGGPSVDSEDGVVVDLTAGKEWWVGNSWGLGVAAGMMFHSISDGGFDQNWTGSSFALRFSATYN